MRTPLVTFLVVAIMLMGGMLACRAQAMMPVTPAMLAAPIAGASLVQKAKVVCGNTGCVPVQVSRIQKRKPPPVALH